ncbi:NUDIX domain-containing protein [Streptomyces tendae]|uniref:NUDIX domain-containing protein n=1 Tax=Streptomyces tendae TaxID=1932 RepID=UPI0033A1E03C
MTEAARTTTAALLECLAEQWGSAPVSTADLARRAGIPAAETDTVVPAVLALMSGFGVLREQTADGDTTVTVISSQAAYFLRSLAAYLRSDRCVLDNWERAGAEDGPYSAGQVLYGPQFLYLAEHRRAALDADAPPLREVDVVQVITKARQRGRGTRAQYLFQYDERARQYQLPGGHVRASDADPAAAAVRELEEELAGYVHHPARDVLSELGTIEAVQPSRTFGVVTKYRVTFFHLKTDPDRLLPGPAARWLDGDRILDPAFRVGRASLNVTALVRLDAALPGGLRGLPTSVPEPLSRSVQELVRDRPWEAAGLAVGIIGLVVSLIPLFL